MPPTLERVIGLLSYDQFTGKFTWLVDKCWNAKAGSVAGSIGGAGYVSIKIDGVLYRSNRLAWLLMTGEWPRNEVDHRDGNRTNDAWANLRSVTRRMNCQNQRKAHANNELGLLGVHMVGEGRYRAQINIRSGVRKHIGYFKTAEAAHAAYLETKRLVHEGCTL